MLFSNMLQYQTIPVQKACTSNIQIFKHKNIFIKIYDCHKKVQNYDIAPMYQLGSMYTYNMTYWTYCEISFQSVLLLCKMQLFVKKSAYIQMLCTEAALVVQK